MNLLFSVLILLACLNFLIKTLLGASQIKSLTKSTNSCDFTFINIPNNKRNKLINIGVYYRHCLNNKSDMINFINELENSLENNCIKKHKLVITGDFNADLCQINKSIDITTYFNCLLSNNVPVFDMTSQKNIFLINFTNILIKLNLLLLRRA